MPNQSQTRSIVPMLPGSWIPLRMTERLFSISSGLYPLTGISDRAMTSGRDLKLDTRPISISLTSITLYDLTCCWLFAIHEGLATSVSIFMSERSNSCTSLSPSTLYKLYFSLNFFFSRFWITFVRCLLSIVFKLAG